ncbi:hypothetical protein GLAREA_05689 [Glarea lozoyensis ATCC 20868]|uniref:Uncharacterized protein n=1 Tax=Glarea lozoyensis (strain ATCC 20868 / MF5171) TaxID=1116229 RepID=S3DWP2_GLAL2|nr:uncharacterized protein GLAREA_05689 [Glarea lozoyensis ATCC 20868]EPE36351.1 hypothetical protein GLAREA_05689 [Glarea lozoyensis ATCC 20868]
MPRFTSRRSTTSTTPPRRTSNPNILPYRDQNNRVAYTSTSTTTEASHTLEPIPTYDSDAEPLISSSISTNSGNALLPASAGEGLEGKGLSNEEIECFTATGRPMPRFTPAPFMSMATDMYSLPQLLPVRYTDDSVIPAIVVGVVPGSSPSSTDPSSANPIEPSSTEPPASPPRKKSIFDKFKRKASVDTEKGITKVVYMPRREYMKFFARDLKGEYVGTEPYRRWSEGELDEVFRGFQPKVQKKAGYRVPS